MAEIQVELHGRRAGLVADGDGGGILMNRANFRQVRIGAYRIVRIPAASVLTLNATPFQIIPAPDTAVAIVVTRIVIYKAAGTAYTVTAGRDLVAKYTNGSGAQVSAVISATGFLDQATKQTRYAFGPSTSGATAGGINPVAGAAIVLHALNGENTAGTSDLIVETYFDEIRPDIII